MSKSLAWVWGLWTGVTSIDCMSVVNSEARVSTRNTSVSRTSMAITPARAPSRYLSSFDKVTITWPEVASTIGWLQRISSAASAYQGRWRGSYPSGYPPWPGNERWTPLSELT